MWLLTGILVVTSTVALFYYLRIIVVLFSLPEEGGTQTPDTAMPAPAGAVVLSVLVTILSWLGVYPAPLIATLRAMAKSLT